MTSTTTPRTQVDEEPPSAVRPRVARRRRRWRPRRIVLNALGLLVFVLSAFPLYWMVATAFKTAPQIFSTTPTWIPSDPTLDNFGRATGRPYFWEAVRNSLIVVIGTVVISLAVAFLAAIAVARFNFRGRKAFIVLIVAVQMVPLNALIIPVYLLLNQVGQTDRLTGVIVTYLTFVLPFSIWTLRGFVINIPQELEEAAMVDGCSRVGAFLRIVFPLVAPGLVATGVFAFIQAWNEYLMAYVLLSSPEKQTLTVWLAGFTTTRGTEWGPLMAAATLTAVPVIVFFLLVQRKVAMGVTAGAVKG